MRYNIEEIIDNYIRDITHNSIRLSSNQKECIRKLGATLIDEFDGLRLDRENFPDINSSNPFESGNVPADDYQINTDLTIILRNRKGTKFKLSINNENIILFEIPEDIVKSNSDEKQLLSLKDDCSNDNFMVKMPISGFGHSFSLRLNYNNYVVVVEKENWYYYDLKIFKKDSDGLSLIKQDKLEINENSSTSKKVVNVLFKKQNLFEFPDIDELMVTQNELAKAYYLGKLYATYASLNSTKKDSSTKKDDGNMEITSEAKGLSDSFHEDNDLNKKVDIVKQIDDFIEKRDKLFRIKNKNREFFKELAKSNIMILDGLHIDESLSGSFSDKENKFVLVNNQGKRFIINFDNEVLSLYEIPSDVKAWDICKFTENDSPHNSFRICCPNQRFSSYDCAIRFVSGNDVIDVKGQRVKSGYKGGFIPIYNVGIFTNTADVDTTIDNSNGGRRTVINPIDKEEWSVPVWRYIEEDYSERIVPAKVYQWNENERRIDDPKQFVSINGRPLFKLEQEPGLDSNVFDLMYTIGLNTQKYYYSIHPNNYFDGALMAGKSRH